MWFHIWITILILSYNVFYSVQWITLAIRLAISEMLSIVRKISRDDQDVVNTFATGILNIYTDIYFFVTYIIKKLNKMLIVVLEGSFVRFSFYFIWRKILYIPYPFDIYVKKTVHDIKLFWLKCFARKIKRTLWNNKGLTSYYKLLHAHSRVIDFTWKTYRLLSFSRA